MTLVLVDASLLVAALIEAETHHESALRWLNDSLEQDYGLIVATHTIAELYAGLTKADRVPPLEASRLIDDLLGHVERVIALTEEDYRAAVLLVSKLGLKSGIIYDAVLAEAAKRVNADLVATLDKKHFDKIWPPKKLVVPV